MNQLQTQQTKGVRVFQTDTGEVKLSPAIIREYLVNGNKDNITDQELMMFLKLCEGQKLNPFIKEAYLIKYGSSPATMVTSKDVFMKRAANNQDFNGLESGVIVTDREGEVDYKQGAFYMPQTETLVGAWAKVYRKSWALPITSEVNFDEYAGKTKDGKLNSQWATKPATMIAKVAESHALRKAFTGDMQGMYTEEEMNVSVEVPNLIQTPIEEIVEKKVDENGVDVRYLDEEAILEVEAERQAGTKQPF